MQNRTIKNILLCSLDIFSVNGMHKNETFIKTQQKSEESQYVKEKKIYQRIQVVNVIKRREIQGLNLDIHRIISKNIRQQKNNLSQKFPFFLSDDEIKEIANFNKQLDDFMQKFDTLLIALDDEVVFSFENSRYDELENILMIKNLVKSYYDNHNKYHTIVEKLKEYEVIHIKKMNKAIDQINRYMEDMWYIAEHIDEYRYRIALIRNFTFFIEDHNGLLSDFVFFREDIEDVSLEEQMRDIDENIDTMLETLSQTGVSLEENPSLLSQVENQIRLSLYPDIISLEEDFQYFCCQLDKYEYIMYDYKKEVEEFLTNLEEEIYEDILTPNEESWIKEMLNWNENSIITSLSLYENTLETQFNQYAQKTIYQLAQCGKIIEEQLKPTNTISKYPIIYKY